MGRSGITLDYLRHGWISRVCDGRCDTTTLMEITSWPNWRPVDGAALVDNGSVRNVVGGTDVNRTASKLLVEHFRDVN